MERKKFLKQNSQNKWQKRGLEDNYFKLPFSQNILPKILRILPKMLSAHNSKGDNSGKWSAGAIRNLKNRYQTSKM